MHLQFQKHEAIQQFLTCLKPGRRCRDERQRGELLGSPGNFLIQSKQKISSEFKDILQEVQTETPEEGFHKDCIKT